MRILPVGFVSGIDATDGDIVVIVEVTDGSFAEWLEQEVAHGSIELEL